MKELQEVITKTVKQVLKEELGISREAYNKSIEIYNFLTNLLHNKSQYRSYDIDNFKVYGINYHGYYMVFKGFSIKLLIQLIFINGEKNLERYQYYITTEVLGYDQESNELIIRYPIVMSEDFDFNQNPIKIDDETEYTIFDSLQHELKHVFQKYMVSQKDNTRFLMSFKQNEIYQRVTNWIKRHGYDGSDLSQMFWAVYYLAPVEITANLQMLYGHIKRKAINKENALGILRSSDFMGELNLYSDLLDRLEDNQIRLSDLQIFEMRVKKDEIWLMNYIRKGINKMMQGVRKMEKLINREFSN